MKIRRNNQSRSILLVFILILMSFLDILPSICSLSYYYDNKSTKFYSSLHSTAYLQSIVFIIGITIPLLLEILIDIRYINWELVFPRILVVGGLLITQCIFYFSNRSITLFVELYRARGLILSGGLIIFLFESHSSKYDKIISNATLFTGIIYSLFTTWIDIKDYKIFALILLIFRIIAGIELISLCLIYFTSAYKEREDIKTSTSRKLRLAYAIMLALYYICVYGVWFIYGAQPWENVSSNELICYNILEACTMLAAIIVPARLLRLESYSNEVILFL